MTWEWDDIKDRVRDRLSIRARKALSRAFPDGADLPHCLAIDRSFWRGLRNCGDTTTREIIKFFAELEGTHPPHLAPWLTGWSEVVWFDLTPQADSG